MSDNKETSLEEKFALLDKIVEGLERTDISLEDAFQSYSKGMELLKECSAEIDTVEKKVLKLTAEGRLEEFDDGEA